MTSKQKNTGPFTFGLDIGIASVGWAVLAENRVVDLGVRGFDKAETAKEGESLNLARRTARLLRRRLRRRAWRLTKLARLLKRAGLIADVNTLKQAPAPGFKTPNLWQLRVAGLERKLEAEEWARVIYHLCKHRGFHWTSRAEEKAAESDSKGESGKVKTGLAGTKKLMEEKKYRSAAEMVWKEFFKPREKDDRPALTKKTREPIFDGVARNKQGDYSKALSRALLAEEFSLLFQQQRAFGNPHADAVLEQTLLDRKSGLFWVQKPALAGKDLLKMLGFCTFEKTEYRAPKASFTAEQHVWLTRLNNLRILQDGTARPLTEAERQFALPLPYQQASDFSYKQLRNALVKDGYWPKEGIKFGGLAYPSERQKGEEKAKDPEEQKLVKLPGWQTLHKALKEANLEAEWQKISVAALDGQPQLLDDIAVVLSVYKDDGEVEQALRKLDLPNADKVREALLGVRFSQFSNLSLKALRRIVPLMAQGKRYDEAVAEIPEYGHHSQLHKLGEGEHRYLPPFYSGRDKDGRMVFDADMDVPRNPVVLRSLNQARKVVNALIRQYGSPHSVHIEMARDLSRPIDERREVEKLQKEFRERNEQHRADFAREFNIVGTVKGKVFEKYQLYREQQGKSIYPTMSEKQGICAYSLQPLDLHRVLYEEGYAEIDHALPYSRSFDDSKNNRVLVLAAENRNKGNQTPYEYLDGQHDSPRWREFVAFVSSNKTYRQAKRNRLLRKDFGDKEAQSFRERNLNDTRYICRFFKNYVERYLKLHEESEAKRCVVLSGQLTAFLRARWGLLKVRADSDRHHALDAAVVAACSHGMVKRLSDYARRKELEKVRDGFVDRETGDIVNRALFDKLERDFPAPWAHFRHELEARLKIDNPDLLREEMQRLGTYPPEALEELRPLFVSRAPQRRNGGAVHKETIYGKARNGHVLFVKPKKSETEAACVQATPEQKQGLAIERIGVMDKDSKGNYKLTVQKLADIVDPDRNERMVDALKLWLKGREEREKAARAIESGTGKGQQKRPLTVDEETQIKALRALPRKPLKHDPESGPFTGPIIRAVKLNAGKTSGIEIRHGIATNDSMLRVDVFTKAKKFHLVPVYVHHRVSGLPNRAIVQGKDETEWTEMDETFQFLFSLHPNDLVRISQKGKPPIWGYYSSCHRGTGNLNIWAHDRNKLVGKDGLVEGLGVKTALNIEKFNVDVLGHIYPAPAEQRRDLA